MISRFRAVRRISQDVKDNKVFDRAKSVMPVMAAGGQKSMGPMQAVVMPPVANKFGKRLSRAPDTG
jgi:hypothetical protein